MLGGRPWHRGRMHRTLAHASDAGAGEGMRCPDERGGVGGRRGRRGRHRGRKRRASLAHVGDRCGSPWRPGSMQERDEVARVRAGRRATAGAGNGAEMGADPAIPQAGGGDDLYAAGLQRLGAGSLQGKTRKRETRSKWRRGGWRSSDAKGAKRALA